MRISNSVWQNSLTRDKFLSGFSQHLVFNSPSQKFQQKLKNDKMKLCICLNLMKQPRTKNDTVKYLLVIPQKCG